LTARGLGRCPRELHEKNAFLSLLRQTKERTDDRVAREQDRDKHEFRGRSWLFRFLTRQEVTLESTATGQLEDHKDAPKVASS
jgi:hypothetical protein